jgi:acetyl esterase/lipase
VGHSAGGHLGLVAAHRLATEGSPPEGAIAIGAPTDLRALVESGNVHAMAITSGAGGDERWEKTSPVEMVPLGVRLHIVHGSNDTTVDPASSRRFAEVAHQAGDDVTFELVNGDRHSAVLWPGSPSWAAVVEALRRWSNPI